MNKNRLNSFMARFGDTQKTLAAVMGISLSQLNAKINETGGVTVTSIVAAVFVTYLAMVAMGRLNIPALLCLGLIFVIAALCGIGSVGFLQKRGFCLLAYTAILAFLTLLHIVLAYDSVAVTRLVERLTGYYELEATAFYLLYANLFFIGFSVGSGVGAFLWRYGKRPGYDKA